jgi:hypothetical protein
VTIFELLVYSCVTTMPFAGMQMTDGLVNTTMVCSWQQTHRLFVSKEVCEVEGAKIKGQSGPNIVDDAEYVNQTREQKDVSCTDLHTED